MIIAFEDRVVVKLIYTGKIADSTLIIPEGIGIKQNYMDYYGEVVSIGIKYKHKELRVGDKIFFPRNEGHRVIDKNGDEYLSLRSKWILAVINDSDKK